MGERLEMAFPFPVYEQELVLEFSDAGAAGRAELALEPVYGGHERAVSSRWDDNEENDLRVKALLDAKGSKATWYLNNYMKGYGGDEDFRGTARELLENGFSIGGHGYNHPYITYTNRNRMFQEMAQVRIEWEAELDTYVNSYAFSFVNYRNAIEGDLSQADVIRSLERAGFYHLSVFKTFDDQLPSEMIISLIMPPENQPFEVFKGAVDWAMGSDDLLDRFRNVSHSMHAWYATPRSEYGLDELERRVDYLNSFPDLWHCNQNEYAAYRYQFLNTQMETLRGEGDRHAVRISRPMPRYLNDAVPLTLSLKGISIEEIKRIAVDDQSLEISRQLPDRLLFDLPHSPGRNLPVKIGRVENPDNLQVAGESQVDPDFPEIRVLLSWSEDSLSLALHNVGEVPVEDLSVTYRLPLAWEEGILIKELPGLSPGQSTRDNWSPSVRDASLKYMGGTHYFVAQLDFRLGGRPGRLYATCSVDRPFDASFPRDAFVVMGPVHPDQFDLAPLHAALGESDGAPPDTIVFKDGQPRNWRFPVSPLPVPRNHFDPEVVPTTGDWFQSWSPVHLLYSIVESPAGQPARLLCDPQSVKAVFLNGQPANPENLSLREGDNHLIVVHDHQHFTGNGEHAAAFLRLTPPGSSLRLQHLRFRLPPFSAFSGK